LRQLFYRLSITGISAGRHFSLFAQAAQTSGWQPHPPATFFVSRGRFLAPPREIPGHIVNERTEISARFHRHLLELQHSN
jgi:hypothetical protein